MYVVQLILQYNCSWETEDNLGTLLICDVARNKFLRDTKVFLSLFACNNSVTIPLNYKQ